jgi:hypothetical protein
MADPARVMLGHPGPPGQGHAPDGSARHALQGRRQVRVAPVAVRRQAVAHRLARTPAQPSPGAAWLSACQHVTSDRKIPIAAEVAALRCRRHHHRGDALHAGPHCTSTGHVWITVWRRHGLNPFRIFSLPIESMAFGLVTGAWRPGSPGMPPGIAPPSGHIAQFIHKPCTQPPYAHDLAGLA